MESIACLLGLVFSFAASHAQDNRLPYAPCGSYDIGHVEQHFAAVVSTRRLGDGMIEITIVTTAPVKEDTAPEDTGPAKVDVATGNDDTKKQFPVKDLVLVYRSETGESLLETPLAWTKPRHPAWPGEQSTSFKLSPDAARRASLQRIGNYFDPPRHSVVIGFKSLLKKPDAQGQ